MKTRLICFLIFAASLFNGCKKSESTAPAHPQVEKRPSAPEATAATKPEAAPAQDNGVLLRAKWPVGNRYTYRLDLDQHVTNHIPQMPKPMQQDVTMGMTYALSVDQATANDGREISLEFLANEMEVKMGEQTVISFDSKESGKSDAQNPFAAPFRKMIGSKVKMLMNAKGEVEKVAADEWRKSVTGDDPGGAGNMLAQQFNEGFFRQIVGYASTFPEKPVQVGDTWPHSMEVPAGPMGKITVESKVTFNKWEDHQNHHCAVLPSTGTFKGAGLEGSPMGKMSIDEGKLTGTSWFDPELGALIESTSDQTMQLKGDMPGMPGGGNRPAASFTVEIGQRIALNLVDLAQAKK
jgi:hypothetical protein